MDNFDEALVNLASNLVKIFMGLEADGAGKIKELIRNKNNTLTRKKNVGYWAYARN